MCCRHQIVSVPREVRSTSVPVLCAVLSTSIIILYIVMLQIAQRICKITIFTQDQGKKCTMMCIVYINKFLKYSHNIPYRLIVQTIKIKFVLLKKKFVLLKMVWESFEPNQTFQEICRRCYWIMIMSQNQTINCCVLIYNDKYVP